ncbi:hypothetical protein [Anaerotignum propionicum]|uniref:hypothetical protein n=1 Tax=Anaerotignum propionicum TaxID=28446 RepID=UPI00289BFE51|nr:hypothetical protein [Anaerotignum propionicum]
MSKVDSQIKYWRNSLADAARINIDAKKLIDAFAISRYDIQVGCIDANITDQLFREVSKNKKDGSNGEKANGDFINALICPIKAVAKVEHGSENNASDQTITPLWIPAVLTTSGRLLHKKDSFPWIPRELLEPSFGKTITVGCISDVDEYMTLHKTALDNADNWSTVWEYSKRMLEYVIGYPFDEYAIENYEIDPNAYILVDSPVQGAAKNIISLYDNIIRDNSIPLLLERYASIDDEKLLPMLDYAAEIEICKKHVGQMGYKYPLSVSQRQSMHHFLTLGHGQILAVNGPPGTGKTTLLQSVVASLWVEAAVNETDPLLLWLHRQIIKLLPISLTALAKLMNLKTHFWLADGLTKSIAMGYIAHHRQRLRRQGANFRWLTVHGKIKDHFRIRLKNQSMLKTIRCILYQNAVNMLKKRFLTFLPV